MQKGAPKAKNRATASSPKERRKHRKKVFTPSRTGKKVLTPSTEEPASAPPKRRKHQKTMLTPPSNTDDISTHQGDPVADPSHTQKTPDKQIARPNIKKDGAEISGPSEESPVAQFAWASLQDVGSALNLQFPTAPGSFSQDWQGSSQDWQSSCKTLFP